MSDERDLPLQDTELKKLPPDMRELLAEKGRRDLYFFGKAIMGYRDMTPNAHAALTVFVNDNPAQFKVINMPRDTFKTSCITVSSTVQNVVKDPNSRNLIANESATNASRMLRAIRQHAESNRVFRALYSSIIPDPKSVRWNDEELDFRREWIGPEPTIDTVGMTGAFTSRHYTRIICDDPISEEALKSHKVMEDTINRFSSFLSLLSKPATDQIILVGTRWAGVDIYSWAIDNWGNRCAKFIRDIYEDGTSFFPEVLPDEILTIKRAAYGEYKFSCLYRNNPRLDEGTGLNIADLRWWAWNADESKILLYEQRDGQRRELRSVDIRRLDITTTVDLAPAESVDSDRNAVVTTGVTAEGDAIVLDAWAKRCRPQDVIEKLFEVRKRFQPRVVGIENVAYQAAFKWFLKAEADRRGYYINVKPLKSPGKQKGHIRGLQPIMATGRLFVHPMQSMLRNEMADYPSPTAHDDLIDALAMQQQLWRGIMSPESWARYKEQEARMLRMIHGEESSALNPPLDPASPFSDPARQAARRPYREYPIS